MSNIKRSRVFGDTFLNPYRQIGDVQADELVETLADEQGKSALSALMQYLTNIRDCSLTSLTPKVKDFFVQQSHLPSFADAALMGKALAFFWKHEQQIPLLLGCYSLPYCYAAADGAQVLWLSERIKKDTQNRLEETGEFVFGIMQERDWRNERNLVKILKIRLMHAVVRYFTRHYPQWNPDWGLPINQEDMAGTNLAFSYIVIRGLRKMGITTNEQEEEAYLHFWRVVGKVLGVEDVLLPHNLREAFHLDKAIARRQFKTSEAGTGLTAALIKTLQKQVTNEVLSDLPTAQMRLLLGDAVANILNIPKLSTEVTILKNLRQVPVFQNNRHNSVVLQRYSRK